MNSGSLRTFVFPSHFGQRVNAYEYAWRDFFVPRIMSYQGLAAEDFDRLPRFEASSDASTSAVLRQVLLLGLMALALSGCIALARRSLEKP